MTTDPTPELCCTHGERIDRILELMEDVHAARVGKPRFATGGYVKAPDDGQPIVGGTGCVYDPAIDGPLITAEQARSPEFKAALDRFNAQVLVRRSYQQKDETM